MVEHFSQKKIKEMFISRKVKLASMLENIDFVSTTADGWSSPHRKKFIGETVYWFNTNNKRVSACLSIKRIIGPTTYVVIGRQLETTHADLNISGKISMMTTDNGFNFLKAARLFSEHSGAPEFDEEQYDEEYDIVEFLDLNSILENQPNQRALPRGVLPICLPPHSKCACHLSNLCCTVDISKVGYDTFNDILSSIER